MSKKKVQEKNGVPTKGQRAERTIPFDDREIPLRPFHSITHWPVPEDETLIRPEFGLHFPAELVISLGLFAEGRIQLKLNRAVFYEGPLTEEMMLVLKKHFPRYAKDIDFILSVKEKDYGRDELAYLEDKFCSDGSCMMFVKSDEKEVTI